MTLEPLDCLGQSEVRVVTSESVHTSLNHDQLGDRTGLTPRDVTPEATLSVLDRQVPGVAEAMRQGGMQQTPLAMLSRAVAGLRGRTLIINLPGSEKAVRENLAVILPALAHAVESLQGRTGDHQATSTGVEKR